ncbi:hypothetical protein AB4Z48_33660 [Cupriavidus sp. 2TAF22]|uniref:hypothetical protein n=1 Tax=unclassified Cupriavidus TaxID=2640874 RepID=UPI003F8F9D70
MSDVEVSTQWTWASVVRRIAMEAAARMLFKQDARDRAIGAAVAEYAWDLRAARECRGTLMEVESTWIPPGKEQLTWDASEEILDAVAAALNDYRKNGHDAD